MSSRDHHVFSQFKSIGLVCNRIPGVVHFRSKTRTHIIICAVGRVFRTYNADGIRLLSTSDPHPADIEVLAADDRFVYTGCQNVIRAFHLSRQVEFTYNGHEAAVSHILPFGPNLITIDSASCLKVFDIQTQEIHFDQTFDPTVFKISAICHPATYVNKILLGSTQGRLKLVNVQSGKLVYEFAGWGSPVTVIQQSPVLDLLAIGLDNGKIIMHNIKSDETLFQVKQPFGTVLALTFRLDNAPIMMSATEVGHVCVWDLEKRHLAYQIESAHRGNVLTLAALPGEPIVVTTGSDNAIRTWRFQNDGVPMPTLLSALEGHYSPPRLVHFINDIDVVDEEDCVFLSAASGDSRLRQFSVLKDRKQNNFGTAAKISKKAAKKANIDRSEFEYGSVHALSVGTARAAAWDNVVCCHDESAIVTTWCTAKTKLGKHRLCHGRFSSTADLRNAVALCCTMSICGNFAVIGYSSGHLDVFNVQSGLFRGSYKDEKAALKNAHEAGITGVCTDQLNQITLSGDDDGCLKYWRFKKKTLIASQKLQSGVDKLVLNRDNNLVGIALRDFSLVVVDLLCRRVVRQFSQVHGAVINDLTFAFGGNWLVSCSMDRTIKVWDLRTSELVDIMCFAAPCTSVGMSGNGHYLATTFVGLLGIYIWTNKAVFQYDFAPRPIKNRIHHVGKEGVKVSVVDLASIDMPVLLDDENEPEVMETSDNDVATAPDDKPNADLTELSGKPLACWTNLLHADIIKERNRPQQPAVKVNNVPFFLPTTSGLDVEFDISQAIKDLQESKIADFGLLEPQTEFARKLKDFNFELTNEKEALETFRVLSKYSTAGIDFEIRGISPLAGGSVELMANFLKLILACLKTGKDFDAVNACLGLFLKLHRDILWSDRTFEGILKDIQTELDNRWTHLDAIASQCLGLVQYLKNSTL